MFVVRILGAMCLAISRTAIYIYIYRYIYTFIIISIFIDLTRGRKSLP